jgi:hypothetical protein
MLKKKLLQRFAQRTPSVANINNMHISLCNLSIIVRTHMFNIN